MSVVKINIDLINGVLDIEGDSEFVEKQIDRFEKEIKFKLSQASFPSSSSTQDVNEDRFEEILAEAEPEQEPLGDIFEKHGESVHIVKDIPGTTIKEKIVYVILLLAFERNKCGQGEVLLEDIRAECTRHGCMDTKNFAKYVKSYSTLWIDSGGSKLNALKLTMPGINAAKELIKCIRSNSIGGFFKTLSSKPRQKNSVKKMPKGEGEDGPAKKTSGRPGPGAMIKTLQSEGFFDTPKGIEALVKHCDEVLGYSYAQSEFGTSLLRAVRKKMLNRNKNENKQYEYTSST